MQAHLVKATVATPRAGRATPRASRSGSGRAGDQGRLTAGGVGDVAWGEQTARFDPSRVTLE
ncbi:MAG: hypothetical protein ACRDGQ_11125, partial [Candidatus Limnocylindrales bacterium]